MWRCPTWIRPWDSSRTPGDQVLKGKTTTIHLMAACTSQHPPPQQYLCGIGMPCAAYMGLVLFILLFRGSAKSRAGGATTSTDTPSTWYASLRGGANTSHCCIIFTTSTQNGMNTHRHELKHCVPLAFPSQTLFLLCLLHLSSSSTAKKRKQHLVHRLYTQQQYWLTLVSSERSQRR